MKNPYLNLSDEKLMELYQGDDYMAFEVIYSRYKDHVYSYLKRRVKDTNVVDDIFQGVFAKFHKSRQSYSKEYPLIKWLYTVCRSEFLDFTKKKKIATVEWKEELHVEESADNMSSPIDISSEKSLSSSEKEAISLRFFSDQEFQEISRRLNTSESNARKLISRGLGKLRMKYLKGAK